jgi:hypothetical protein
MLLPAILASALCLAHTDSVTYAVLDIANESGQVTALSNYIGDELSLRYGADSGYQLLERAQIRKVFKEHGFQSLGAVDAATAASMGKILGATRLMTGSYYVVGDDYVTHVRVIDVQTGKIVRMFKTSFPKSPSTTALVANVLAADPGVSPPPQGATASGAPTTGNQDEGPLTSVKCQHDGQNQITCSGKFTQSTDAHLQLFPQGSRFIFQNGVEVGFNRDSRIAGHFTSSYSVPAGVTVPVEIIFSGNGSAFAFFHLKYSVDDKEYVIQGARPIN